MRIGIGITTRNRPFILEICLRHFKKFRPANSVIVVVDDSTTPEMAERNRAVCRYQMVEYIAPLQQSRGIAKAKNACLSWIAPLTNHMFLFDDDCFPYVSSWAEAWIAQRIDHLCYNVDLRSLTNETTCPQPTGNSKNGIDEYNSCLGCMMYVSKNCFNLVGYFDWRFGIYGYEHAQYTQRAFKAGLSPYLYSVPSFCRETIFSLDMDFGWFGQYPPLAPDFCKSDFTTSVTPEEAAAHTKYSALMQDPPMYIGEQS